MTKFLDSKQQRFNRLKRRTFYAVIIDQGRVQKSIRDPKEELKRKLREKGILKE